MLNPQAIQSVHQYLAQFATTDDFEDIIESIFGTKLGSAALRQQWLSGDFSLIPEIKVLSNGDLGTANGAYAADLDEIFVSIDFLGRYQDDPTAVAGLLLEEIGHKIDRVLNGNVDSPGDEGAIFSSLVRSMSLDTEMLQGLKAEDDSAIITVDGASISVEQATNIIKTATGDGALEVTVDEFGRFGSKNVGGSSAFYNPIGSKPSSSTTYSSFVALGIIGTNGTTGVRRELQPSVSNNEVFTSANTTTANSTFTVSGLQFQLKQLVQDTLNTTAIRTGSRIDQTYTITNTTANPIAFDLVRYVDGDLLFDGSLIDGGGRIVQNEQEILFETDSGGTRQTDTTFFGITGAGAAIPTTNRWELDDYSVLRTNVLAGNNLRNNIVRGDSNSDGFINSGAEYDVALALRNVFSLTPGQSTVYTSTTRFGSGEPVQLDITPPTGSINNLTATTIGNNVTVNWGGTDPGGIKSYDVFVSTNGADFTPWQTNVTTTTGVYTGETGNTYTFYSLATDNAGNQQSATTATRTSTQLINPITLAVAPSSVDEDGTTNIVYTFTRTGSNTNPLTVNFNVAGSATFNTDYVQTGAASFGATTGTVTFAAGASTANVTIDPTTDTTIEFDETITLALAAGTGYTLGTNTAIVSTLVDNKLPTTNINFLKGSSTNDPHIETFDGSEYDFQAVGEFTLVKSTTDDFEIQARQQPWSNSTSASANAAIAIKSDGQRIAMYADRSPKLVINGEPITLADRSIYTAGSNTIIRQGSQYQIVTANKDVIQINDRGSFLNVNVGVADNRNGKVVGLLGNSNQSRSDEFALRDGTAIGGTITSQRLYGDYGNSWRITQATSLFDYATGTDTTTFTNLSFPQNIVTIDTITPAQRAAAEQIARNAGITDPEVLKDAIVDIILTNGASEFIQGALSQQRINLVNAPNTLINPDGTGSQLTASTVIPYSIRFGNNAAQGSTPVAKVTITQQLDTDLDFNTFSLNNFGFGTITIDVPTGAQTFSQRLDLRTTRGVFVDVKAGLDKTTGIVTWTFIAIDPTSGNPANIDTQGFLPPDNQAGVGRGTVGFIIQPKASSANGTRIDAQATIIFNTQTPIQTNPVFNLIGTETPTIFVTATDSEAAETLSGQPTNPGRFTLTRTGTTTAESTVNYTLAGTATNGKDYPNLNGTATFTAGSTTTTIDINPIDDKIYEATKTVILSLAANPAYIIPAAPSPIVNLTDNDAQIPQLTQPQPNILSIEGGTVKSLLKLTKTAQEGIGKNEAFAFVVDDEQGRIGGILPGAVGYINAALDKSQVIFSNLGNNSIDRGFDLNSQRYLNFTPGDRVEFGLIVDDSIDKVKADLTAGKSTSKVFFSLPGANAGNSSQAKFTALPNNGGYQIAWEDNLDEGKGSNNTDFNDLLLKVETLDNFTSPVGTNLQGKSAGEVLDLRNFAGQTLKIDTVSVSDATYNNYIGFYAVEDTLGTLANGLKVTDTGYAEAAIKNAILRSSKTETLSDRSITGGKIFAPVMVANGTFEDFLNRNPQNQASGNIHAYFNYLGANSDKVDHFRLLGDNKFGVEDLYGGGDRDYNDIVFQVNVKS